MNPLRSMRPVNSAPVARRRLQILIEHDRRSISQTDLKEWLTYLSSDEMQGRQVFTEGYGAAAEFVAGQLRQFGVKPIGEHGGCEVTGG